MSQETLGELSGIHYATIKKYELGIRNPKPEQLLKISNALGISINVFLDLDISTCKLRLNGTPVPLLRNGYSIFNGTKYR